jgi:hypothetical protein
MLNFLFSNLIYQSLCQAAKRAVWPLPTAKEVSIVGHAGTESAISSEKIPE